MTSSGGNDLSRPTMNRKFAYKLQVSHEAAMATPEAQEGLRIAEAVDDFFEGFEPFCPHCEGPIDIYSGRCIRCHAYPDGSYV